MGTQMLTNYIKYLINDCYKEDYNPFIAEFWYDNFCYTYTFSEWYFLYRKYKIQKIEKKYNHTPDKLIIGNNTYK